jgi:hypothetical protein
VRKKGEKEEEEGGLVLGLGGRGWRRYITFQHFYFLFIFILFYFIFSLFFRHLVYSFRSFSETKEKEETNKRE